MNLPTLESRVTPDTAESFASVVFRVGASPEKDVIDDVFAPKPWVVDRGLRTLNQHGLDVGSSRRSEMATIAITALHDEPTWDDFHRLNIVPYIPAASRADRYGTPMH